MQTAQPTQVPGHGCTDRGGRPLVKNAFYCDSFTPHPSPALSHEKKSVVNETGQFYPSYTIAHYRLSKKTPFRVNHQIQDEKVLICKSAQAFPLRAGDGKEGTNGHAAASPLGQVCWQALRGAAGRMHPAFRRLCHTLGARAMNALFKVEKNEKVLEMVGY